MADEQGFDPTQYGATAVAEPPPFDPTQHGAIPVQAPQTAAEPSILQKTGRAVVDTLKGFLPQSLSDIALAPVNMIPGFGQAVKPLENIVFGRPISEGVNPLAGIPVVQRIPEIIATEKTPALSQERFTTGAGVVADLAMVAGLKSALHPELAEVAGIPKPEVVPETPLTTEAKAAPIVTEPPITEQPIAQPVPAAESVATAPLPPETVTPTIGEPNAVQEQSPSSILPHPQEGITETGGERGGVGQGVQGQEPTEARQAAAPQAEVAAVQDLGGSGTIPVTGATGTGEPQIPTDYATKGTTTRFNVARTQDTFEIGTKTGAKVTGYLKNQDFPNEGQNPTRGEIFITDVPEAARGKGEGYSLTEDAVKLIKQNGGQTVNFSPKTAGGQAVVDKLVRNRIISEPIRTSATGKSEHSIIGAEPTSVHAAEAATTTAPIQEIPKDAIATVQLKRVNGEPVQTEMNAREAEGIFTKERSSYKALLDCLGA